MQPNIIGLEKVYVTDNTLYASLVRVCGFVNHCRYMFQDLATAGDLFSYIDSKNGRLLEVEAAVIVRQIVIALCFLHEKNIVHRDLKPDNILMTHTSAGCRVVLTDFGAARRIVNCRQRMVSLVGTDEYAAPEVGKDTDLPKARRQTGYSMAIDMWSLGCVTVILLTGGSPFIDPRTNYYSQQLASECNLEHLTQSKDWQKVRPRPKHFVSKLLCLDEDARMTAEDALNHDWFSNDLHKTNFEDLYDRTIKNWRPRLARNDMLQFHNANEVRYFAQPDESLTSRKRRRPLSMVVESTMQPAPRGFLLNFWPKKSRYSPLANNDVQKAILEYWSLPSDEDNSDVDDPSLTSMSRTHPRENDTEQTKYHRSATFPSAVNLMPRTVRLQPEVRPESKQKTLTPSIWKPMPTALEPGPDSDRVTTMESHANHQFFQNKKSSNLFSAKISLRPAIPGTRNETDPVKPCTAIVRDSAALQLQCDATKPISNDCVAGGGAQTSKDPESQADAPSATYASHDVCPMVENQFVGQDVETTEAGSRSLRLKRSPFSPRIRTNDEAPSSVRSNCRRRSVFDLEPDDNETEDSRSLELLKKQRNMAIPNENYFKNDSDEEAEDDDHITLSHRSPKLSDVHPHQASEMLYLPR